VTPPPDEVLDRARNVRLLLLDCDGVLTDGRIIMLPGGDETKAFDVKDGHAIVMASRAGLKVGIISGRVSSVVRARAEELGIDHLYEKAWVKLDPYREVVEAERLTDEEVCYVGDDVVDLGALKRAGVAVSVADGIHEVKMVADYVTEAAGGRGAVREVVELILRAQNKWNKVIEHFSR